MHTSFPSFHRRFSAASARLSDERDGRSGRLLRMSLSSLLLPLHNRLLHNLLACGTHSSWAERGVTSPVSHLCRRSPPIHRAAWPSPSGSSTARCKADVLCLAASVLWASTIDEAKSKVEAVALCLLANPIRTSRKDDYRLEAMKSR